MAEFVHLHVHSEYSLLDGAARIRELAGRAASLGMKALALTDHGVMYGAIPFYKACKEAGVKPIIGCEFYYTPGSMSDRGSRKDNPIHHLTLLAANLQGYRNLMKLCSIGHLQGFYYKPRIDMASLESHAEGIVCLSGCLVGELSQQLLQGNKERARDTVRRFKAVFGDRYYIELQDHGLPEQRRIQPELIALAREEGIPLAATNDVHYVEPADHAVQDILLCIGTGKSLDDPERLRIQSDQLYLKSGEEMARLFPHVPEAIHNTAAIAERCTLELEFGRMVLPRFHYGKAGGGSADAAPASAPASAAEELKRLCRDGLLDRYAHSTEWQEEAFRSGLTERLDYELSVIEQMGFSDYFLIVWDFIRYAHEQGIVTGPGRGSAAGSLVAYSLKITDVDPIRHGLLFERFLNPERVSMPDIDIDFDDERRDEVIAYVVDKYGADHVAQIITFGTMAAKAAVRDVGRAAGMAVYEVDRAAKLIPGYPGVTLREVLADENGGLRKAAEQQPALQRLLAMAERVEGMPRHASTHAAGVVISRELLTDHVPLQAGTEKTPLTQYSMEHLEAIGLLKMDFLGLRNLSIIERTLRWVQKLHGTEVDFKRVDEGDEATYQLMSRGDTTGVFQLESAGMRRVLKELKPSRFEDIVSVLALYRPGPMEFIPQYVECKHGRRPVHYPHPALEPILADTFGIIVYQEQIMQIASVMAGFSLGEADLLRRAMSKKKREVLDEQRAHFVAGSLRQGFREADAHAVYDMIVRFADYGFCRAHAAAYAVLSFQTAYLKAHYPECFMAAMLTSVIGNQTKTAEYIDECRRMGIRVLPPDVNESSVMFTPGEEQTVRFGLAAVKNVGTQAMEAILEARKERPFDSMLDLCRRVELRVCNKRVLESLILSGAADRFPGHRAQLLAMLDETVEAALKWKKDREDLQLHLFGLEEEVNWALDYPEVRRYTAAEQLELEKELLGLYLSGHPLDAFDELLKRLEPDPIHLLPEYPDDSLVRTAGRVVACKIINTRKGDPMAFMELEDRIAKLEVVLFPGTWRQYQEAADTGSLILVEGRLQQQDEEQVKLLADRLYALADPELERLPPLRRRPPNRLAPASSAAAGRGSEAGALPTVGGAAHGASQGRSDLEARPDSEPATGRTSGLRSKQKVFVKIAPDREDPELLKQLQDVLKGHGGPLDVVLFYEKAQKLLALNGSYRVKPSPELFRSVEAIMGDGAVRVK